MKKIILLLIMSTLTARAATWTSGSFKVELLKDKEGNWVSSNCLSSCKIDQAAKSFLEVQDFSQTDLSGGKNPGSAVCKKINGRVIYLNFEDQDEAFCELDKEIVSLSRLFSF